MLLAPETARLPRVNQLWAARLWHGVTFGVAMFALVTQTILVISGAGVLVEDDPPALPERIVRLLGYFTIQSNLLVALSIFGLAPDPRRDGRVWGVLRLAGLVGIAVTGIVHWFLLRPLLDLSGWSYLCDLLLHIAVPLLAVVGWLAFGPRPRVTLGAVLWTVAWPAAWLAYTLVRGAVTGFYPYPFLDVGVHGGASVAVACLGVTGLIVAVALLVRLVDRRLAVPFLR